MLCLRLGFAALAASSFCPIASAQLAWQSQLTPTFPYAVHDTAMAADPTGGGVLLFSGSTGLNDTWRWNGTGWQQLTPVTVPPGRYAPRLAADTARGVIVLFGGFTFTYTPTLGALQASFDDTWEWNGANWIRRFPATTPPARYGNALAYDARRRVTVMFGGLSHTYTTTTNYSDTWEWDGVDWTLRPTTPMPPMQNHSMAYDAARGVVVLAQGGGFATTIGTLEWDGIAWTARGPGPSAFNGRIAYDAARERVVWYGGCNNQGHALPIGVLEWDGLVWTPRTLAVSPPPRHTHAMAYDPVAEQIVVYGGRDDSFPSLQQLKTDTWTLSPVDRATTTPFGSGCPGTAGPLTIGSADRPWLGTTMRIDWTHTPSGSLVVLAFGWSRQHWLGVSLPLPLGAIGMTGCSLLVSLDLLHASATTGSALQQALFLPNVAAALGSELSLQAFGFDPAANPAGIIASPGLALRLGGL